MRKKTSFAERAFSAADTVVKIIGEHDDLASRAEKRFGLFELLAKRFESIFGAHDRATERAYSRSGTRITLLWHFASVAYPTLSVPGSYVKSKSSKTCFCTPLGVADPRYFCSQFHINCPYSYTANVRT